MSDKDNKAKKLPLVLIVDDAPKNIQVLGNVLSREDCQIAVATNGKQCLKMVEKVLPDLILLDIMMPEMNGFEVCESLKASTATRHIPIIFLTAKTETEDIVKGFKLGAVDYVTKPFNSSELLARVKTQLELKKSRDTITDISNDRKELLHVLFHDLSNPFASIISALEVIEVAPEYQDLKEDIATVANNGFEVINLLREMHELEENHLNLHLDMVNLKEAIRESMLILKQQFSAKNIELIIDVPENLSVNVEVTSFISSVLHNIFTNAIKFSPENAKVEIRAKLDDDKAEILVKDNGIGIPKEELDNIFDINSVSTRLGTQGEKGTGFGMPLVKKFVDAYGGEINIQSADRTTTPDNHGTEVTITLDGCEENSGN